MECFTPVFSQCSGATVTIFLLRDRLGTCHQFQALQGISLDLLISYDPKS